MTLTTGARAYRANWTRVFGQKKKKAKPARVERRVIHMLPPPSPPPEIRFQDTTLGDLERSVSRNTRPEELYKDSYGAIFEAVMSHEGRTMYRAYTSRDGRGAQNFSSIPEACAFLKQTPYAQSVAF